MFLFHKITMATALILFTGLPAVCQTPPQGTAVQRYVVHLLKWNYARINWDIVSTSQPYNDESDASEAASQWKERATASDLEGLYSTEVVATKVYTPPPPRNPAIPDNPRAPTSGLPGDLQANDFPGAAKEPKDPNSKSAGDKTGKPDEAALKQSLTDYVKSLAAKKQELQEKEKAINSSVSSTGSIYYDAKEKIAAKRSEKDSLQTDKQLILQKWSTARFDRCPEHNAWEDCSHEEEKQSWIDDRNRELQGVESQLVAIDKQIAELQQIGLNARKEIEEAKQSRSKMKQEVEFYKSIIKRPLGPLTPRTMPK